MTMQERRHRALECVLAADAALSSAIMHEEGDRGLELIDASAVVGLARYFLMAAGAFPEAWEEPERPLTAPEAARRADAHLRQAAGYFPRGVPLSEDDFEALVEVWGGVLMVSGWL